ncbi:hypothetical protein Tco_1132548 [Tanacetum coccineum]|uniref:Uncharacterized protein n=1 Tax=Tanacetum coccineum TaxID=301880 RepID=A0ABQ5JC84_9ASTR
MAVLDSCPKHNMVAYLEKSEGNAEFHEIIDFLKRSSISSCSHYHFPVNTLTSKVFSFMVKKGKTIEHIPKPSPAPTSEVPYEPQTDSSPAQTSEVPIEHQPNPSPRPYHTDIFLILSQKLLVSDQAKEIQALKAQITKLKKQAKPNEGRTREMVDEDKEIDERILSTEDVLSTDKEGVSTDFEKVSTDRPIVSTDGSKVSTDRHIEGTEEHNEGTEEQIVGTEENIESTEEHIEGTEEQVESTDGHKKGTEEEIAAQATQTSTQTPTSKIFGDDETIAKVLLNMSQAKAVSRERRKVVERRNESEVNLTGLHQAEKKFKSLKVMKSRLENARRDFFAVKLQEQEREQFTIEERAKKKCLADPTLQVPLDEIRVDANLNFVEEHV